MEQYKNLGGDSAVVSYALESGAITVQFRDGAIYVYNNHSAGAANINEMHRLAVMGQGLNSFIGRFVRKRYVRKLR
ncbi:MAG: hypothetical protein V4454_21490 [Pseudomonadota bacterium]